MVMIGQYEESFLYERSTQIVNEKTSKSNILDREAEDMLPKFAPENGKMIIQIVVCDYTSHVISSDMRFFVNF